MEANQTQIESADISDTRIINQGVLSQNIALAAVAEDRVRIIRLEANASLGTDNFEGSYADYFSDSTGYYNTINTGGSTTAIYDAGGKLYNNSAITMQDTFSDNDYTSNPAWTVNTGTFSAATGALVASTNNGDISVATGVSNGAAFTFQIDIKIVSSSSFRVGLIDSATWGSDNGYILLGNGSTNIQFAPRTSGSTDSAIMNVNVTGIDDGAFHTYKLTRSSGGAWELFVDGVSKATASNSTYTNYSYLHTFKGGGGDSTFDNISFVSGGYSTKILQTANLSTLYTPTSNINGVYVYVDRDDDDSGQTITVDVSVNGGSNYLTSQAINAWISLTANLGTALVLKFNFPDTGLVAMRGFAIFYTME